MVTVTHTLKGLDMFLRKLFLIVGFLLLASVNSHATTAAEECQKRSMSAYDRGSSDAEKQRLGSEAASACFKEVEDSLKKNSSTSSSSGSSSGSIVGPLILLLGVGGFLAYKLATKGDKPLTKSEIGSLREQVREVFKADSNDLKSVRSYKERGLASAEKMFAAALAGELPITANTTKGGLAESRQDIANYARDQLQQKSKEENLIKEATQSLKEGAELLANPIVTAGPDGNPDPAIITALEHGQSDLKRVIKEAQERLAGI